MSISGIGSFGSNYPTNLLGTGTGASGTNAAGGTNGAAGTDPAAAAAAGQSSSGDDSSSALNFLLNYLKESPAQRMEQSWLAQHHLTEQELQALPPAQQAAIRKEMADDITKKMQQASGASDTPGSTANITA